MSSITLLTPIQLYNRLADFRSCTVVVDVRTAAEFQHMKIDGAVHFDTDQLNPSDCTHLFQRLLRNATAPSASTVAQECIAAANDGASNGKISWSVCICGDAVESHETLALLAAAAAHDDGVTTNEALQGHTLSIPSWARAILPDKRAAAAAEVFAQLCNVAEVAYVCGGVASYKSEYPFMCTVACAEATRLWPSQITRATLPREPRSDAHAHARFTIEEEVSFGGPLFLSSHALAFDPDVLGALGITHVVNVTPEHPNAEAEGVRFLRIPVVDAIDQDLAAHFGRACDFIDRAFTTAGSAVLVHCRHGQSRSATIVAAWLMHRDAALSSADALTYLRACRPRVRPNDAFQRQLMAFEETRAGSG